MNNGAQVSPHFAQLFSFLGGFKVEEFWNLAHLDRENKKMVTKM